MSRNVIARAALLSAGPAALLAAAVTASVDYGAGMKTGDSPLPAIEALLHGHLSVMAHEQPVIGLTSIVLRAPFVALASALGGGTMVGYRFGVFACALVVGLVGAVVVERAHRHGTSWPVAIGAVALMVLSPLTVTGRLGGHPEELLAGALCVGAVLAGLDDRPLLAGLLVGLAIGTKEWALVGAVPAYVACRRHRARMLVTAAATGASLALALPLADPSAFAHASSLIGNLNVVSLYSWWVPFSDAHTTVVHVIGGEARATAYLLPLGLTRTDVFWLIPILSIVIGWLYARRSRDRDPADPLGLLALILLLRCTLDPSNVFYYHLPFVIALLAWETITRRGLPLVSLLTIVALWGLLGHVFVTGPLVIGYISFTVALTVYLAAALFRAPRRVPLAATPGPLNEMAAA